MAQPKDRIDPQVIRDRFFKSGRLVSIPKGRAKRLMILDFFAALFEPGERYAEREVNVVITKYFDDHATVRRLLIDEGFLDREAGFYWRAGGTFDVD